MGKGLEFVVTALRFVNWACPGGLEASKMRSALNQTKYRIFFPQLKFTGLNKKNNNKK
jgi:hypothetical protein